MGYIITPIEWREYASSLWVMMAASSRWAWAASCSRVARWAAAAQEGPRLDLSQIELRQLVLFHHLMQERSVSRVADILGLTQPAVSNSLARLRKALGDPLFVRGPAGMLPTPLAEQVAQPVATALALLQAGLNPQRAFDPLTVQASVTLGMTDIGEIVFLPRLVQALAERAPGITVRTVRNAATPLRDDMEAGRIDLAIGPLPTLQAGFFQRLLFPQRYVCLFRRGHPLARGRFTAAAFEAAEHLAVVSAGTGHGEVDEFIRRAGIQRNVRLTVPHFVGVGHILQHSNMVATVTEKLADALAEPFGLVHRPHPLELPEASITLFWHRKLHRDAANRWLRSLIIELFGRPDAEPALAAVDADEP
jgi:DNA-binding transcriptional LysR family regulator